MSLKKYFGREDLKSQDDIMICTTFAEDGTFQRRPLSFFHIEKDDCCAWYDPYSRSACSFFNSFQKGGLLFKRKDVNNRNDDLIRTLFQENNLYSRDVYGMVR